MVQSRTQHIFILLVVLILLSFSLPAFASDSDGSISPSYPYAWGENLGWLNFSCPGCNVAVTDTAVTGYVWSQDYGWINLAPTNGGVTNNCDGDLGGYAWSTDLGWINFSGASINASGQFMGIAGTQGTPAGRINFSCANCDVQTDWLQCALRGEPSQVLINSITNTTVPSISAAVNITNEGSTTTEYQYEWCVVTAESDSCEDPNPIFDSLAAKLLTAGESWNTTLVATVPDPGNYWFELEVFYGNARSVAEQPFTAQASPSGGGGGGGGGIPLPISIPIPVSSVPAATSSLLATDDIYSSADLNHDHIVDGADFSILLYYWEQKPPYKNPYIAQIVKDGSVDSISFSIMLSQWGETTPGYNPLTAE